MKKAKTLIMIALVIAVIGVGFMAGYSIAVKKPLKIDDSEVITVEEGDTFYSVLNKLSDEGKLRNSFFIKLHLKLAKSNLDLLQGRYLLQKDMSVDEIVNTLTSASTYSLRAVTIPEGYTIEDIAEKLAEDKICSSEEFIKAVKNYPLPSFVKADQNKRYNLEGYLFPDTYLFEEEVEASDIVKAMVSRFEEMLKEISESQNVKLKEDEIDDIVTVASMIEKEAVVSDERKIIASVIYNRLRIDMPLQIDATVIYAQGYHKEVVYTSDLEIDSPYNTYMYKGLPIGPIANPGKESLIAAISPAETNYLYYLLQGENTHYFTDNYDDFLAKREELGYNMEE